jgi:hypothetical protein
MRLNWTEIKPMVNPATYHLHAADGGRLIHIEPVYEEITGGDLFPTGRYLITDANGGAGEIRVDGSEVEWEWNGPNFIGREDMQQLIHFIQEYNEPELAGYLD